MKKISSQLLNRTTLSKYITKWDLRLVRKLEAGDVGFSSNSAALAHLTSISEPPQPPLLKEDALPGLPGGSNVVEYMKV